jgi:hypothetical protein
MYSRASFLSLAAVQRFLGRPPGISTETGPFMLSLASVAGTSLCQENADGWVCNKDREIVEPAGCRAAGKAKRCHNGMLGGRKPRQGGFFVEYLRKSVERKERKSGKRKRKYLKWCHVVQGNQAAGMR